MSDQVFTDALARRAEAARHLVVELARLASETRCHDVLVLDVRRLSPVTDFFLIATGTSPRQMRSVCDDLEERAQELGFSALSRSGYGGETWTLIDFVDVIVHLFSEDARRYYDLENLWGDARKIDWRAEVPAASAGRKP